MFASGYFPPTYFPPAYFPGGAEPSRMGIISVDEIRGARQGSIDPQWHRSYRRAWRVITSDPYAIGPLGARLAIPVFFGQNYVLTNPLGAVVEYDNFAFATKIDAQIDPDCNDDTSWIVTVDYAAYDPTQFPENPLNHPIKISWGENRFDQTCIFDRNGNPVVNSAGDDFDPPIAIDDSRPTLRIVRNEATYDPIYALNWKDTLNADVFWGFAPLTVKLSTPLGELEYNPICGFYYVVTYQFEVNPNGWVKNILDRGMRQIVGGLKQKILDDKGDDISSPELLDGNGVKLTTRGTPVAISFEVYNEADFSLLGLDPYKAPGQF
jgi:hypothetical protein